MYIDLEYTRIGTTRETMELMRDVLEVKKLEVVEENPGKVINFAKSPEWREGEEVIFARLPYKFGVVH